MTGDQVDHEPIELPEGVEVDPEVMAEVRADLAAGKTPPADPATGEPLRSGEWAVRRQLLREAMLQAEYATGKQEKTEEQARRGVFRRIGIIVVGFVVLLGGLAMMVLPGPGILGVIAGLAILAQELPWAERLLEYVKKRAKLDELKEQPRWVQALMWTFTAVAVVGSLVYVTVIR